MAFVIKRGGYYGSFKTKQRSGMHPELVSARWEEGIANARRYPTRQEADNIAGQLTEAPGEVIEVVEI